MSNSEITPLSVQDDSKPLQVGKIKFEKGDVMLLKYDRAKVSAEALHRIAKRHHEAFPGVRLFFIPEGLDITRLRFEMDDGKVLEPIHLTDGILKLREREDA